MAVSSTSDKNEQSDDAQQDLRLTRVAGSTSSAGIGRVIHLFWREMNLLGLSDLSTGTTASAIDISWADAAKKSKFKMTKLWCRGGMAEILSWRDRCNLPLVT